MTDVTTKEMAGAGGADVPAASVELTAVNESVNLTKVENLEISNT